MPAHNEVKNVQKVKMPVRDNFVHDAICEMSCLLQGGARYMLVDSGLDSKLINDMALFPLIMIELVPIIPNFK